MKRLPILCVVAQWCVALAADRDPARSRWYLRHLARCPHCQEVRMATAQLERHLRAAAPATRRAPSPQWLPRLKARLRAEPLSSSRPAGFPFQWLKPAWVLGGVGLLGLAAWLLRPTPSPAPERQPVLLSTPALPALSAALERDPLTALATRLSDPLQAELDRMLTDLRKVSHSLAASFLPEGLPAALPPEP